MGEPIDGRWLVAVRQTAGRGRLGRDWDSPSGNFHGSTGMALHTDDPPAPTLALVAAVALHDSIVDASRGTIRPTIKWPNDLLVGDAKIAGILLERAGDQVVVGIGVNLAQAPLLPDRATASLVGLGTSIAPTDFASLLAGTFAADLLRWRATGGLAGLTGLTPSARACA
jgi:BirA family transcriptional regulator, biotin operon repressor / biotin---[acetyl-CoA-carboxylase] ligase